VSKEPLLFATPAPRDHSKTARIRELGTVSQDRFENIHSSPQG